MNAHTLQYYRPDSVYHLIHDNVRTAISGHLFFFIIINYYGIEVGPVAEFVLSFFN